MSAASSPVHAEKVTQSARNSASDGHELPPPAPFDPSTWRNFYYACMVAAIVVGLGTLANGGAWTDAILRMFITLLGGSILAIAFLTFVVVPLHVNRYEALIAAQKAAKAAIRVNNAAARRRMISDEEKAEFPDEAKSNEPGEPEADFAASPDKAAEMPEVEPDGRLYDDQAASLRRMAADSH
ncbi:MAG: hypothetical protein KF753_14595 [Caldilineaceae bacterium]|nr:hypothetical protein [Caldilineaceae bacterium]